MKKPAASISIEDLFFDLKGVETYPFVNADGHSDQLFSEGDDPWSPLTKMQLFIADMLKHNPRIIKQNDGKNYLVERNPDCLFPCVVDVHKSIGPQAQIDFRSLLLRGGIDLSCDGSGKITGPVYIGPMVQIRHNGGLLGDVIVGDGLSIAKKGKVETGSGGIIGHSVTVRRSIVRAGVKIEAHTSIVDSIIGRNVYIDAGAQFPHENFSGAEVRLRYYDDEELPENGIGTGLGKLGVVIGDDCYVGANVSMHPGVVLMPECRVHAGQTLHPGIYTKEFFKRFIPRSSES